MIAYINYSPVYQEILEIVGNGGIYLELGCSMGVDIRRLVFDGCPSDKMVGVDIADQSELGYEMFCDKDRLKAKFFTLDLLKMDEILKSEPDSEFARLNLLGNVDVINISAVFHQWGRETQIAAVKQIVPFTKPDTVVIGYFIGSLHPGDLPMANTGVITHKHNAETFNSLWQDACESTGSKWTCHARLLEWEDLTWSYGDVDNWMPKGDSPMEFVMRRIE